MGSEEEDDDTENDIINVASYKHRKIPPPPRAGPFSQAPIQHEEEHSLHESFDDGWPGYEEPVFNCD